MTTTDSNVVDQLTAAVDEKLDASTPPEWGDELELVEGEKFYGRFIELAIDPVTERPVVRALAREGSNWNGPPVFIRMRTVLQSELDRVRPQHGDYLVVGRGDDREGKANAYHVYAVAVAPCPDPMPENVAVGDGIPF